ncbi:hypothetical protein RvY_16877 [Ramazzottius varieornatus]|uniref:Secreted protein n=1 Tax=Ramazzottius varieornatus TaxID=947166 RepID=A0A1D1W2L2_RAMVA|nr:hypothetical protein RvY_16877 [Ramazzottius varieornatus]
MRTICLFFFFLSLLLYYSLVRGTANCNNASRFSRFNRFDFVVVKLTAFWLCLWIRNEKYLLRFPLSSVCPEVLEFVLFSVTLHFARCRWMLSGYSDCRPCLFRKLQKKMQNG